MQRAFLPVFLLMLVGGTAAARPTTLLTAPAAVKDTITVRLPNRATLTLTVRDAEQLRQLKDYHLDSLTSRLATYITQAETAAKVGTTDQVTMRFYPDKDQPGQNLPEEIRITAHKPGANETKGQTKTQVYLNKKFGIVTETNDDGSKAFKFGTDKSKTKADSTKHTDHKEHSSVDFRFDLGLNTFVNTTTGPGKPDVPSLDYWGWGIGYFNVGLDYVQPLVYSKRAKLALTIGPEFGFNNFRLRGNNEWVQRNGVTFAERAVDTKQIDESTLHIATLNLPVMLRFKMRNKDDRRTLSVGVGGFGGYRISSNLNSEYKIAGNDYKFEDKVRGPLNLNDWQYGLQGELGFHALRFFAKYNLNEMFRENRGPQTHMLSFGLTVCGF